VTVTVSTVTLRTAAKPVDDHADAGGDAVPPAAVPAAGVNARGAVRVVTHLAIWLAFLIPAFVQMAHGWRAIGDNAYVSLRAYQVFSLHPPLVGTWSSASSPVSHTFYCLGPLWFWLLAIPVRLDPLQGALWGSAIWCAAALSLAAEAAWRTKGWQACAAVGFVVVDLLWLAPQLFSDPPWNAFFGLFLLVATIVLAWVVGTGALRWWPVLVLVGSADVQSHMFYVISAGVLILGAPLLAWARQGRPERFRWLRIGLAVGVVLWLPPLIQEVTGHPGNISQLLRWGHHGKSVGTAFGLRTLSHAATLPPVWLRHYPANYFADFVAFIVPHGSVVGGLLVIFGLVVIGVAAWITSHRDLATLAAIALVCALGLVASVAVLPQSSLKSLSYLAFSVWVVGLLLWAIALWAVVILIRRLLRAHDGAPRPIPAGVRRGTMVAVVLVIIGVGALGLRHTPVSPFAAGDRGAGTQVGNIAMAIERVVPPGPVAFEIRLEDQEPVDSSRYVQTVRDATTLVWRLTADGWQTGIPPSLASTSNPFGPAPPGSPKVVVTLKGNTVVSAVRSTPAGPGHRG
jgi:hypothetical protein